MPSDGLTCHEFADFLSDYVEDELEHRVRERFESHLEECPDCVAYLETFRETLRLGRESFAGQEAPPADVPPRLVTAILAARRRPGRTEPPR